MTEDVKFSERKGYWFAFCREGFHFIILVATVAILTCYIAANATADSQIDGNEPKTDLFKKYREDAEKICGGPVLKAGPKRFFRRLVVIRNDGRAQFMMQSEVHYRNTNKNEGDDVWPAAICASHRNEKI